MPRAAIGLGSATFGREIARSDAFAVLDRALERGVTHFDTAALYSAGEAERIIGAWLRERRPLAAFVATKIYPPYTAEAIIAACDQGLRHLRREWVDLLYCHKWDEAAATPAALSAFDGLVRSGKVRALGASNFTAEQLERVGALQDALGLAPFSAIQNLNNFAVREVDGPLKALCARRGIKVVTYSPMGAGFLSGKHRDGVRPGTRFAVAPGHQEIYFTAESQARWGQRAPPAVVLQSASVPSSVGSSW